MKKIFLKILHFNYRKWWLPFAVVCFFIYMMFFDANNIMKRMEYNREIEYLQSEIKRYKEQIKSDSLEIEALKTDKEAIERYAREKYGYKSANEDVYIIELNEDEED